VTRRLFRDLRASAYGHGSEGRGAGWPGLEQVVRVETIRQNAQTDEIIAHSERTFLTSLSPNLPLGQPEMLLALIRGHWDIENKLHHVKDRSMREDAERCSGDATIVFAWARSLAVFLLGFLPGACAPDKFQAVLANDALASNLITQPLSQL
jgi:hypothetical protein